MSSILYYSKFCNHSSKLLQTLSKTPVQKDIHFICIDTRVKDSNNKTFIVLETGQKIIMPENVSRVPALLLLTEGYKVLYGEDILRHLKPARDAEIKQATYNNLEPSAFSFGSMGDIVSDSFSFLDQGALELEAKGSGGMRQLHNYVDLNASVDIHTPADDHEYKGSNKISSDASSAIVAKLQEQREADLSGINSMQKRT